MRRTILVLALLVLLMPVLSVCQGTEAGSGSLVVTEQYWTGWSQEQPEPIVTSWERIEKGSVIYDGPFGTITVKSVSGGRIRLSIQSSSFVRPYRVGTIKLKTGPIQSLTVRRGREAKIVTETLDFGVSLTIRYG